MEKLTLEQFIFLFFSNEAEIRIFGSAFILQTQHYIKCHKYALQNVVTARLPHFVVIK